ncbi:MULTISPECIES: ATP-binding protein [Amycolatopsis]|nr:ATP-binding protein [Amycolatopsis sacchari]
MRSRAEITLGRSPEAPRRARRFVDGVCLDWRITSVTPDAETVASELVENTLRHTGSTPLLTLELDRGELTVAVTDDSPERAFVRAGGAQGGFGLRMVEQAAKDWGCTPSERGGKTVWATLVA